MTSDFGFNGTRRVPPPVNEPVKAYAPGSPERAELKARLAAMAAERIEIPLVIGGKEVRTGETAQAVMPHDHRHVLADWHKASREHVAQAIDAAAAARREWASWPWEDRAAVFLRAAELLATTWRATLNAATMLGQSKTAFQAEIDAACELIDFWRFNVHFAQELYAEQPLSSAGDVEPARLPAARGVRLRGHAVQLHRDRRQPADGAGADGQHRGLEAGLARRCSSAYCIMQLLEEAGLPPGVINFVPGDAADDLRRRAQPPRPRRRPLHRLHRGLQLDVEDDRRRHGALPLAIRASSARPAARTSSSPTPRPTREALAVAHRARRLRVPGAEVLGGEPRLRPAIALADGARPGRRHDRARSGWATCRDFRNFMGAVIDRRAFDKIDELPRRRRSESADDRRRRRRPTATTGYFVEPTLVETSDPGYRLMCEEIFGPVVTVYVYDDAKWEETLRLVDETSPVRAHRRGVRARPRAPSREAASRAAPRGGQLLHQRQADGRGGRPAAVRRRARARARTTRRARS